MKQFLENTKESTVKIIIIILSIVVALLVALLNWGLETRPNLLNAETLLLFPKFHAILNSLVAVLLAAGLYFIKNSQKESHQKSMFSAFLLSAVFLVSYVIYHTLAEPTLYGGEGPIRYFYYILLISHIVLAALIMPIILMTFYYAATEKFVKHRKLAKITWPLWFYVAVTGVVIYFMIAPYY
jgi:putative membrane protein